VVDVCISAVPSDNAITYISDLRTIAPSLNLRGNMSETYASLCSLRLQSRGVCDDLTAHHLHHFIELNEKFVETAEDILNRCDRSASPHLSLLAVELSVYGSLKKKLGNRQEEAKWCLELFGGLRSSVADEAPHFDENKKKDLQRAVSAFHVEYDCFNCKRQLLQERKSAQMSTDMHVRAWQQHGLRNLTSADKKECKTELRSAILYETEVLSEVQPVLHNLRRAACSLACLFSVHMSYISAIGDAASDPHADNVARGATMGEYDENARAFTCKRSRSTVPCSTKRSKVA